MIFVLWGLRLLAALLLRAGIPSSSFILERHPYQPVPHPDDRADTDQDHPEGDRDISRGPEEQHQDPGGHGR